MNQCSCLLGNSEDLSLKKIVAVGKKNKVHLLSMLVDSYSKYRLNARISVKSKSGFSGPDLNIHDFINEMSLDPPSILMSVKSSIKVFQSRVVPGFNFQNTILIDDNCDIYIEYTLKIAQMLNVYVQYAQCIPLQVYIQMHTHVCTHDLHF